MNSQFTWHRGLAILVFVAASAVSSRAQQAPLDANDYPAPIKLACIGDSITQGVGASPGRDYPDQLQALLGSKWIVKNFGVSARTLLRKGDIPWWNDQAFKDAHAFNPDAVVIMLGTNDTKPQNWVHQQDFYGDYKDLIESFKVLPSRPHIWIVRPPPVIGAGNYGINEPHMQVLLTKIDQLAQDEHVGEIDVHGAFRDQPGLLPDRVHPNDAGAHVLARTVAHAISN